VPVESERAEALVGLGDQIVVVSGEAERAELERLEIAVACR